MNRSEQGFTVLILLDHYLPGYRAGGPIRTIAGIVHHLADQFAFQILTRDRDLGGARPYPTITSGRWISVDNAACRYLAPRELQLRRLRRLISDTPHDVLYVNSLFSWRLGIVPILLRRLKLIPRRPTILAPRGQLDLGALGIKKRRKLFYLIVARLLHLYDGVLWHASTTAEEAEIRRWFGSTALVHVAANLSPAIRPQQASTRAVNSRSPLRIVFLSRISPKKNLHVALEILARITASVVFDIYGPREDRRYWNKCIRLMDALPANVQARYQGTVSPGYVGATLASYDLFFLPTRGENFGHVVLEALLAGCPVLISDQTPWDDVARRGAGWGLPLGNYDAYRQAIEWYAQLAARDRLKYIAAARQLGLERASPPEEIERNAQLFALARTT